MKRKIIDLHCDTMTAGMGETFTMEDEQRHISRQKLMDGGAYAQCFALFIPRLDEATEQEQIQSCYERYLAAIEHYGRQMEINAGWLRPACRVTDLLENEKKGMISSILTLEDGTFVGDHMERLDKAYEVGARALALTWNTENRIGYPNHRDSQRHMLGLKPFGHDAIVRMNELGMLIDVSHLSEGGFWDVVSESKKPFMASHSCCRSLCDHPRNLTDQQLHAMGETGSLVGINFYPPFISEGACHADLDQIVRHMVHIAQKAGIDSLALGADFDGMSNISLEMKDYAGYPLLMQALEREFREEEIDKITHRNAIRLFSEVWR